MYYKLPVKERIELMKSYRKANKDMSYHDMVKDYNDSYEKFGNGGIKKEVPAYQSKDLKDYIYRKQMYNDSLNLSKNSLYELGELNKSDMTYNKFKDIQNHSQTSRAKEAYDNLTKTNGVKPNPSTKVGKEFTNTAFKQEFGSVNIYQPPKQSILPPKGEVKNELTKVNTFVKNQNREPIITHDKNDPRLRAYNDSLYAYQWNKKALDKVLSKGKSPKGANVDKINYKKHSKEEQLNLDYKQYKDWGLNVTKKDVDNELAAVDPYNKGTKKLNRAVSYYDFPKEGGKIPFMKNESDKLIAQEKMLKALKPRDFKAEKANYETQTRGANQMDGSGISSAELAYKYSKLIDPTGVTSAVEIGKNFYNGNAQDPFDYLGLVRIPYIQQGMKQLPKLTKQVNKLSLINNVVSKSHDLEEAYK